MPPLDSLDLMKHNKGVIWTVLRSRFFSFFTPLQSSHPPNFSNSIIVLYITHDFTTDSTQSIKRTNEMNNQNDATKNCDKKTGSPPPRPGGDFHYTPFRRHLPNQSPVFHNIRHPLVFFPRQNPQASERPNQLSTKKHNNTDT